MPNINYKKTGDIFNQHSYWTKQPIESIIYFLKKYSTTNDTVLDPFCGSGMTGIGSSLLNLPCILGDISPACLHISEGYNTKFQLREKKISNFLNKIEKLVKNIYLTSCLKCKKNAEIKFEVLGEFYRDEKNNLISDSNEYFLSIKNKSKFISKINKRKNTLIFDKHKTIKICYICSCSKEKKFKRPDQKDLNLEKKIEEKKISFPNNDFFGEESKRNIKKKITKVHHLYSIKNLYSLNIIRKEILKIKDKTLKKFLLFNFSSILFNCSLMSRYRSYENTSIKMGTYYVPSLIKDNNVLTSFKRKVLKTYKSNKIVYKNVNKNSVKIRKMDATDLSGIKTDSIDLIYTDPPYSDIINYSELNLIWESWLSLKTNYKNEMIVCKDTDKTLDKYFILFQKFLKEAGRVLKIKKKMILIFHHPNIEHWSRLQKIIMNSPFKINGTNEPYRIISDNKTSSQHKTNKKTQSFIALILENKKTIESIKLKSLNNDLINKVIKLAKNKNYKSKSEVYDFFINYSLNKFDLKLKNIPNILI
jgi:DNA modification methylase|tara:strand:+ start:754 stop:2352 length:1599 start_codon:yes stop_codon:yes gene_type:complete